MYWENFKIVNFPYLVWPQRAHLKEESVPFERLIKVLGIVTVLYEVFFKTYEKIRILCSVLALSKQHKDLRKLNDWQSY